MRTTYDRKPNTPAGRLVDRSCTEDTPVRTLCADHYDDQFLFETEGIAYGNREKSPACRYTGSLLLAVVATSYLEGENDHE